MIYSLFLIGQTPPRSGDDYRISILRNLTMDDLEARLGKGRVVIGGHPNSGRIWQIDNCHIGADGFDRDRRGSLLTDGFAITKWKGNAVNQYPFTLLPGLKNGRVIAVNDSPGQLEQVLMPTWKRVGVVKTVGSTQQTLRFKFSAKSIELTLTGNFTNTSLVELVLWIER